MPPAPPTNSQPSGSPVPPPAPPAYGQSAPGQPAPGQPGYGQPAYGVPGQPGYAGQVQSNITINLWLSVFFSWVPALIFYLVEKDKVPANYHRANAANLNYQIVIVIAYAAVGIITLLTFGIGAILYLLLPIAQLIIGILHAINVPGQLAAGQEGKFYLAPNWVK
ncbi:DUF4870 domain-containing protein [Microbacterium sp.]|uniref:DUF4870 domain-containing protein n=1 Tax=Microbacterium sp. TaxID=51671 RepID=UPI002810EB67|nr:DUF4870 domain-containing protein [Microbacterium sp.]